MEKLQLIPADINRAYERVVNKDVRYRFLIDMALKALQDTPFSSNGSASSNLFGRTCKGSGRTFFAQESDRGRKVVEALAEPNVFYATSD